MGRGTCIHGAPLSQQCERCELESATYYAFGFIDAGNGSAWLAAERAAKFIGRPGDTSVQRHVIEAITNRRQD